MDQTLVYARARARVCVCVHARAHVFWPKSASMKTDFPDISHIVSPDSVCVSACAMRADIIRLLKLFL